MNTGHNISDRQARKQRFSVCIFPLILQPLTAFGTLSGVKKVDNIKFRK
jgi:hypothetical protein